VDDRLTKPVFGIKYKPQAEVAELADALRSGRSEGSLVRVQIPPPAFKPAVMRVCYLKADYPTSFANFINGIGYQ
jgi:hypothetical protein